MTTPTQRKQQVDDKLNLINDQSREAKKALAKLEEVLSTPPPPSVNEVRGVGEEIGVWMARIGEELAMLKEHDQVTTLYICFISQ